MPVLLTTTRLCWVQQLACSAQTARAWKRGLGSLACLRTQASTLQRKEELQQSSLQSARLPEPIHRSLINHIQKRYYPGSDPSASDGAKVLCSTQEHSPGHNVATISFSNPAKLNIVNRPVLKQLIQTCEQLSKDDKLRVVVLSGAPTAAGKGASFVGGADIREMSHMSSYEEAHEFITLVHNACAALRDILPVPVIARINGFCLGAGLEIAASCDLRVATKDSLLGMPEVKIGLPSVVEAAYLPGLMGWGRARRFLYLAENISGTVAEKWGLVEEVVEDESALDKTVEEWVNMLVKMGPKCIRSQKRLMQKWENSTVDEAVEAGVEALAEAFRDGGKEPRGLMQGFLNRKR